jgi:hypothetical protein
MAPVDPLAPRRRRALVLLGALTLAVAAPGCRGGARVGGPSLLPPPDPSPEAVAREEAAALASRPALAGPPPETRRVEGLGSRDFEEFNRAWVLFLRDDPRWEVARDAWLARGGAAPYVLAENLVRYFVHASGRNDPRRVERVARNAAAAGEPAVAYFAELVVLDERPLPKPVTVLEADGSRRTVTHWTNDDVTRQHAVTVVAAIGPVAVPVLLSPRYLNTPSKAGRRYVAYALGRIATDQAVDAAATLLSSPDWTDRAAGVKALSFALDRNARARAPLERASADPDPFVQKKAKEALSGKVHDDV